MAYTINKLAKLSGVSIRTLHYYDEIGLLKPAYLGDNNYRYYEEAELLQLQQILFYREVGLPLNDIKRLIFAPDFDRLTALESHRDILAKNLDQTKMLIETVDKTIAHLKGNKVMNIEEVFQGFTAEKQKMYQDFLVESGIRKDVINQTNNKVKDWTKDQWLEYKREGDKVHTDLIAAINKGLSADSPEVQNIIQCHYMLTTRFWTPNRDTYIGLSEFYSSHEDFVKFYDDLHPELLGLLQEAMKVYADNNLNKAH